MLEESDNIHEDDLEEVYLNDLGENEPAVDMEIQHEQWMEENEKQAGGEPRASRSKPPPLPHFRESKA